MPSYPGSFSKFFSPYEGRSSFLLRSCSSSSPLSASPLRSVNIRSHLLKLQRLVFQQPLRTVVSIVAHPSPPIKLLLGDISCVIHFLGKQKPKQNQAKSLNNRKSQISKGTRSVVWLENSSGLAGWSQKSNEFRVAGWNGFEVFIYGIIYSAVALKKKKKNNTAYYLSSETQPILKIEEWHASALSRCLNASV